MRTLISALLVIYFSCCYSQQQKIDSLWNKVNAANSDTQKVNSLNKLFFFFNVNNSDSAFKIAEQALQLAVKIKYSKGEADANNNLGTNYFYKGNNTRALMCYLSAAKSLENESGAYMKSVEYKKQLSVSYNNIGTIYQRQKLYEQAENYFRKSIAIDESTGDKIGLAHCYNNIGTIKEETNKYDEAIKNYEISIKLKQEAYDTAGMPSTLINMGVIRMNQNKFKESEEYFERALAMSKRANNMQDEALALINLGDMFYLKKDYSQSVLYYEKGIEVCKKQKYTQFLSYAYNSLSLSFYRMKDFEKAYDCYDLYVRTKDSLYNSENVKIIHELEAKYESGAKEKEIKLLISEKEIRDLELTRKKIIIYVFIVGLVLLTLLVFIALNAYRQKRNANKELDIKNRKIEIAYRIIEEKQKEIVDSINYAKRIQYTLLAHKDFLQKNLNEHFILFKPKDIVSGDFYWATKQGDKFYLAVCDSTGHGVPGAFMSLLNIGFLSEAINEKGIYKPNEVLNYVRKRLVDNISNEGQKDGFDGIVLCIDKNTNTITYAAAHNNPVLVKAGNITHLPFNKMPVGIGESDKEFDLYTVEAEPGSMLYLYTDGYADQFGGPKGKKYKYKQLEELLLTNHQLALNQQQGILNQNFEEWKGNLEQVDDVLIIGIRL
ncbi:MAG: tetratricopeptide repeat protein [Bacteroidota bacterium]|nr:tetratricopeptide repeat protein [Bacteroidota bacterium]